MESTCWHWWLPLDQGEAAAWVDGPQATSCQGETAKGPGTPTGSSFSEASLSPTSQGVLGLLASREKPRLWPSCLNTVSRFLLREDQAHTILFPRGDSSCQWGLARPVGSQAPCGLSSSLSACSKPSSWGLQSKGHISNPVSLELPTLNFVPYVVCEWRGLTGV